MEATPPLWRRNLLGYFNAGRKGIAFPLIGRHSRKRQAGSYSADDSHALRASASPSSSGDSSRTSPVVLNVDENFRTTGRRIAVLIAPALDLTPRKNAVSAASSN